MQETVRALNLQIPVFMQDPDISQSDPAAYDNGMRGYLLLCKAAGTGVWLMKSLMVVALFKRIIRCRLFSDDMRKKLGIHLKFNDILNGTV